MYSSAVHIHADKGALSLAASATKERRHHVQETITFVMQKEQQLELLLLLLHRSRMIIYRTLPCPWQPMVANKQIAC